jgi:hypothetical protein
MSMPCLQTRSLGQCRIQLRNDDCESVAMASKLWILGTIVIAKEVEKEKALAFTTAAVLELKWRVVKSIAH